MVINSRAHLQECSLLRSTSRSKPGKNNIHPCYSTTLHPLLSICIRPSIISLLLSWDVCGGWHNVLFVFRAHPSRCCYKLEWYGACELYQQYTLYVSCHPSLSILLQLPATSNVPSWLVTHGRTLSIKVQHSGDMSNEKWRLTRHRSKRCLHLGASKMCCCLNFLRSK